MPNLRPKIFWNFFLYRLLWTLNLLEGGVSRHQLFFGHSILEVNKFSKFFPLPSILDSEFVRGCQKGTSFFLVMPNLTLIIFQNISFTECSRLNVQIPTFFWSCQIWDQKFFGIFSFTKCSWLWNFLGRGVCLDTNFFWSCQMWGQKIFRIFSFIEYSRVSIFWGGWRSGHQLF